MSSTALPCAASDAVVTPAATSRARLLGGTFAVFNVARVFAYLPTLWAIVSSGDSSQHSLVTWFVWLGANLSMAGWLHQHEGGRCNRAVLVNIANAVMCTAGLVTILWFRFQP